MPVIDDYPLYSISDMSPEEIWDVGQAVPSLPETDTCFVLNQLPAVILSPEYYDSTVFNLCTQLPLRIDTLETFRHYIRKGKYNWHLYLLQSDPTAFQN